MPKIQCLQCRGEKAIMAACPNCGGHGRVYEGTVINGQAVWIVCPVCKGTLRMFIRCPSCQGRGHIEVPG